MQGCTGTAWFYDAIIVTGNTTEQHMNHLRMVFSRLWDAGFRQNRKKCEFFREKIRYLGFIIDKHGLHKDPEKILAIVDAPRPTNETECIGNKMETHKKVH